MNYTIKNTTEQIENIGGIILAGEIFKRIGLNIQATDEVMTTARGGGLRKPP